MYQCCSWLPPYFPKGQKEKEKNGRAGVKAGQRSSRAEFLTALRALKPDGSIAFTLSSPLEWGFTEKESKETQGNENKEIKTRPNLFQEDERSVTKSDPSPN